MSMDRNKQGSKLGEAVNVMNFQGETKSPRRATMPTNVLISARQWQCRKRHTDHIRMNIPTKSITCSEVTLSGNHLSRSTLQR